MSNENFWGPIVVAIILFLGAAYGCSEGRRGKAEEDHGRQYATAAQERLPAYVGGD